VRLVCFIVRIRGLGCKIIICIQLIKCTWAVKNLKIIAKCKNCESVAADKSYDLISTANTIRPTTRKVSQFWVGLHVNLVGHK
jgi:hypothetical protein